MASINFRRTLEKELKDPEFKRKYDALEDEFKAIEALIDARAAAGLTQAQLAQKMGVKQSAVARIESGVLNVRYKTLLSYLKACGKSIAIV
jgi:DNA polymerase III delta prime subunit